MTARGTLLLAALAVAVALLFTTRRAVPPAVAERPQRSEPARAAPRFALSSAAAPDAASIRDVFRFASRPPAAQRGLPAPAAPAAVQASPPAPEGPRLVGLVRRHGKLFAAFAVGDDVVLAGPGDEAAGLVLLEVSEEGVRVRRRDGREELLTLP